MYQASKKFGDAIAGSNRKFNTRLLENEKVLVESVKNFTITSGAEEITIGSAVASYVQATIENKGIALSGKEVSLEIGVEVDGEMEYIPMGLYTIQNPKIESNKVTFTAYDRLASRCNGAYYSKLGYPVDAVDILAEISTMTGVAIDTSTLQRGIQINQRAIIKEGDYNEETEESEVITTYVNPFDGYTYKETIGFIAGLFGKFAICGRTGIIEFRWYQGIDYEIPSNIFYNDLQETEESFSIKRLTCDNSDQTLSSGSGATGISMQNPIMTQSILDGVYNTVQGLVFTPAALRFIGDMRLDIGDIVTAVKNDGTKFTIPIISLITSYDGGLMQTIASYGNTAEEDDSDTKGPITEMAERVEYELAFVKKLMVDNLTATNATIKNLSGDVLKFKTGEFENLKSDVASFKETTTTNLNAANAKIENLEANAVKTSELEAKVGTFGYLKATDASLTYATITNLKAESGKIDDLQSDYATFKTATVNDLKAANANIQNLTATKATITDLNAATAKISVLEGNYANLNTLVNGNLTSANIQNLTLTSKNTTIENSMIKNAMIENLAFDKITGMDINTTNLTVHSSDGKSKWTDNTIQISDANRVRVQIGKNASNDYSMSVWDKDGKLIWDALGATEHTIQRKIIRDNVVADNANISGSKLDINSVVREVNGSTTKLKSSVINMNDKNQTLDVVFNELATTVDEIEVGGRNLLVQKNITQGYLSTDGKGSFISSGGGDQTSDWIDVSGNKYITITLYEDFTNTNNSGRYCEYDADKNCINTVGYNPRQKSSIIIELKTTTKYIRVTAIECKTRRYKIETGNKPTDWTPAPEDTQSQIDNITEITTSHTTSISTMQGQISSLISEDTTIKGNYDILVSKYNSTVETVNGMKTTIGEHTSSINNVSSKITTIEANLSGITTRVSASEEKFDNLQIGGRNLVKNSAKWNFKQNTLSGTFTQTIIEDSSAASGYCIKIECVAAGRGIYSYPIPNSVDSIGKVMTISFYAKCNNSDRVGAIGIENGGVFPHGFSTAWEKITHTYTATRNYYAFILYDFWQTGDVLYIKDFKVEFSSKATDWTPALEDTTDAIKSAETKASQTADKFNWLVKSGDSSSNFTLTDRVADLVADRINFKGLVTFSGTTNLIENSNMMNGLANITSECKAIKVIGDSTYRKALVITPIAGRRIFWGVVNVWKTNITYSVSFVAKSSVAGQKIKPSRSLADWGDEITLTTSYTKYTTRIKSTATADGDTLSFSFSNAIGDVTLTNVKLETGMNPTDWSPAPGDYITQASLVRNWTTNTTWIDGGKIYTGSITADKIATDAIRSKNYVANSTGSFLNLKDGSFDSKYLKWDASGNITAKGGTIGKYKITDQWLITGSGSTCTGIGGNQAFWAGADSSDSAPFRVGYDGKFVSSNADISGKIGATSGTIGKYEITDTYLKTGSGSTCSGFGSDYAFWAGNDEAKYAPFRVEYDGTLNIEHITVHGNQEDVYMKIGKDFLTIQDVNTSAHFGLDGFDFAWANSRIRTGDQGIELYGDTPYIDFHYNNSYADYTSRIIAQSNWDCLSFTGSILLGGHIYNSSNGHYTWDGRTDAYLGCGNYNNTNNIYYYAGYHAFYVNGDSGSGMMYIETSGVSSRKGFRNSSDERIKKDFKHFDDDFINSYMQLEPVKYRFKDDSDDKYHIGFKAQNVDKTLNAYGKKYDEQFGICITSHINPDYAKKAYGIENMNEVYTLAYDELIGANTFMIQKTRKDLLYQAGKIDIHEAIINDLQFKIAKMEKKIEQLTKALA